MVILQHFKMVYDKPHEKKAFGSTLTCTCWVFTPRGFTNILSVQIIQNVRLYHMYYILNMYFCNVCAVYQNEFATLTWKDLKVTQRQTRMITYRYYHFHKRLYMYHVIEHIFPFAFSKRNSIIYGYNVS